MLTAEEFEFAASYWDIGEMGDMHHNPAKNVLHVKATLGGDERRQGGDLERMRALRDVGAAQAAGGAEPAADAVYRQDALYGLECDGGDGVSGDGAGAADGIGAGVCAASRWTGC